MSGADYDSTLRTLEGMCSRIIADVRLVQQRIAGLRAEGLQRAMVQGECYPLPVPARRDPVPRLPVPRFP